jgi:hypothetical protein
MTPEIFAVLVLGLVTSVTAMLLCCAVGAWEYLASRKERK